MVFILRYLDDERMRGTIQLQLNHGEHRHDLTRRCLFFANRGEFRTGDLDEIMNKASCLSPLSNAVLVWNTVWIAEIVNRLRASGEEILDSDLARVSPLCRAHIIPTVTYSFDPEMPGVDLAHNTLP
jgi:TnpA family transposase